MLSVITCTHDPRPGYFQRVLDALRTQTLPVTEWEYLVVDNASAEPLAAGLDLGWHPRAHVVREERLGLTPARLRGIAEASGELLVFVDDDNVLAPDYLDQALRIARAYQMVGAWGGRCEPEFEYPPPDWVTRHRGHLALRDLSRDVWSNLPYASETIPTGAGLCVRASVSSRYLALHAEGRRSLQLDRTGSSLVSGGDTDLALCAMDIGLGTGMFTALRLVHLIPAERLREAYLLRLVEGVAFSGVLLARLRPELAAGARRSSRVRRVLDALRTLTSSAHERRCRAAAERGRRRAEEWLRWQ